MERKTRGCCWGLMIVEGQGWGRNARRWMGEKAVDYWWCCLVGGRKMRGRLGCYCEGGAVVSRGTRDPVRQPGPVCGGCVCCQCEMLKKCALSV